MVRWRCSLFLAMLLLLPVRIEGKSDDDDEEDSSEDENDDNDTDDDDDADEPPAEKTTDLESGRRVPSLIPTPKIVPVTRTTEKRPLECYVCAYKADAPMKSCLDPTKFRVHTMTCHSMEDKCFTMVVAKSNSLEAVVRGCRSGCVGSTDTTCCEVNRCNSRAFSMPIISRRAVAANNKATKTIPTTVLFFVTILLVLQTVVKVAFV